MNSYQPWRTALLIVLLTAVACKKDTATQSPVGKTKLSQVSYEFGTMDVAYNAGDLFKEYTISNNGSVVERTTVYYTGTKIDSVISNDIVYRYAYNGNQLSTIEAYPPTGEPTVKFAYVYNNNVLTERIKYGMAGQPKQWVPGIKTKYTFSAAGNLVKTQLLFWMLGSWSAAGEVVHYEYDDRENSYSYLEQDPFLPQGILMKNNPRKIVTTTFFGDTTKTVDHTYTYNQHGQPVTRQTVVKIPGAAETRSAVTFRYGR
jgi:hypothetical protein